MTRLSSAIATLVATLLLAAACSGGVASPSPQPSLTVVTSVTVLADLVRQVAGEHVEVRALVPAGTDVHTFDPAPSDAVLVSRADLLVVNGLGLDEWLIDFAVDSGSADTPLVELAEDLDGVVYLEGDEHHDEDEEDHAGEAAVEHAYNPHLWLNVAYARLYVARIADALAQVDPSHVDDYRTNAADYDAELAELDTWVRDQLATIPAADRDVVSFHHVFPYFAAAYGLEIADVLVEVPGQEPSAAEVAAVVQAIRRTGARLVLAESQFSDRLAQTVAAETGAVVVSDLYTDSLGDAPADTYSGAMRQNVERILAALR